MALVARGAADLERVVEDIRRAGGEAHAIVADVGDKKAPHAIAGTAQALVGPVDVLVQAASTLGNVPLRPLLDTDCEALALALEVNVVGPFRLAKLLVAPMVLRGRGLVVHITSDASVAAYANWGAYGASKAALDHLGRIWGAELEGRGVRVVTVDPGEMDTVMHADAIPEADPRCSLPTWWRRASCGSCATAPPCPTERASRPPPGKEATAVTPAAWPREAPLDDRLLVLDPLVAARNPRARAWRDARVRDLAGILRRGDLLVLNDAATVPASLRAVTSRGEPVEVRLAAHLDDERWRAALLGAGDWHTRTEDRPPPPGVHVGDTLRIGPDLAAVVEEVDAAPPAPARPALHRARERAVVGPLPSRPARAVRARRAGPRPLARADALRGAPLGGRDAERGAAADQRAARRAAGARRPPRHAHARRRPLVHRRSRHRRGAALAGALRRPGGHGDRRRRDARRRRTRRRRRHDRRARPGGQRAPPRR